MTGSDRPTTNDYRASPGIRLDFIDWRLSLHGSLRRSDLVETFGISLPQAAGDIKAFLTAHPGAMSYDKSAKRYVPKKNTYRAQRKMDNPDIRRGIAYLRKAGHPMGWRE